MIDLLIQLLLWRLPLDNDHFLSVAALLLSSLAVGIYKRSIRYGLLFGFSIYWVHELISVGGSIIFFTSQFNTYQLLTYAIRAYFIRIFDSFWHYKWRLVLYVFGPNLILVIMWAIFGGYHGTSIWNNATGSVTQTEWYYDIPTNLVEVGSWILTCASGVYVAICKDKSKLIPFATWTRKVKIPEQLPHLTKKQQAIFTMMLDHQGEVV